LIAFQNDDQDELFNHYDDRNKQRLRKLNINLTETDEQSVFLKDLSHKLLHVINIAFKNTSAIINGGRKKYGTGNGNGDDTTGGSHSNSRSNTLS
jgi:hypothetical protein